ncbi:DUF3822 family protein [Algoriphagus halophytocola]|uniref:DUF3822 family protein n=1 Tax=Algoriphagus halophytocola TaxID=2991499 RepID=A0ABY6MG95_9BACT|nr:MULTISPECIES: DUF3822 family protein [unclassified Algoriphagus]UZD22830.1 DUF3822 family protein [Algoriphagus sp. TR-M5]WBL44097.1 DUF3822 family protein [Algoriphagus sp. TR-M9]
MENNLKVFKSDRFDVEDASSLSLFLYPNAIFIFAKDSNNSNLGIHEYTPAKPEDLEQLVVSDPLLKNDIPCTVYVHSANFALVPGVLFHPGKETEYLAFAGKPMEQASFFNTPLDSNNLQVVSCISSKVKKSLEARFSELSFHHGSVSFLSYLFKERFNLLGQEILLSVFEGQLYAAAFTNQELSVFNRFELSGKEDILKYTLILIEQLGFDRNLVRINLYGATKSSEISEEWGSAYFQNFRLLTAHANQNYTHGFKHLKSLNLFEANWQFD